MNRIRRARPARLAARLALPLLALAVCLIALEAATRGYLRVVMRPGARPYAAMQLDDRLGWKPTPSFHRSGFRADAAGNRYQVDMNVDADGFRRYRADTPRGRVLVVGDSYTWAVDAGDDDTYYAHLHRALEVDVDAIGCGGYGTLQEWMLLDQHVDAPPPTLVLLQMCRNDVVNNSYELESRSIYNNNSMRRPFLAANGSITYAFPCGFPRRFPALRDFANRHSRFLYFLFSRTDRRFAAKGVSVEDLYLRRDEQAERLYTDALRTTGELLKRIRARVPAQIPVAAFCTDDVEPFTGAFAQLAGDAGLVWIPGVAQRVQEARDRGERVTAADGWHWAPRGHALAAEVLIPALRRLLDAGARPPGAT